MAATKTDRDKMGWDFLVEIPADPDKPVLTLDQRPSGTSCKLQVKCSWHKAAPACKMSLSSAERLAKDPGPSFVLGLVAVPDKVTGDPLLEGLYLVHLLGANLASVLQRLRKTEADSTPTPLHKQTVTFAYAAAADRLSASGSALRTALEGACGSLSAAYHLEKDRQLRELGYEGGRFRIETTMVANDMDQFVEMMLGLRPLGVDRFETFDERFSIRVPVDHVPKGVDYFLKLEPRAVSTCRILVRGEDMQAPAVFDGDVFLPAVPGIPEQHQRLLVKSAFFTLDYRASGTIQFDFHADRLHAAKPSLPEWRNVLLLLDLVQSGRTFFEVKPGREGLGNVAFAISSGQVPSEDRWATQCLAHVRRSEKLLDLAGVQGNSMGFDDLLASFGPVAETYNRLLQPSLVEPLTLHTDADLPAGVTLDDRDILQVGYLSVAGKVLSHARVVTFRLKQCVGGIELREVRATLLMVAEFDGTREGFNGFVSAAQRRSGLEITMLPDLESGTAVRSSEGSRSKSGPAEGTADGTLGDGQPR